MTDTARIRDVVDYIPGLKAWTTPRGIRVIALDWWADLAHTPEWAANQRRAYAAEREWRREMERDWSTPSGDPFFPEFVEIGQFRFVHPMQKLIADRRGKSVVYRSYDFGRRIPACTWFQYSEKSDRVWLIREFMPRDIQAHAFRDSVRYLSGQLLFQDLPDQAKRWVDNYAAKPSGCHCPPPWFPAGVEFVDISGNEANQGSAQAVMPELSVTREIFAQVDIQLIIVNPRVKARYDVVRRLLKIYGDGYPGLLIDPQCEEALEMFSGGLHYPKSPSADHPIMDKPAKNAFVNLSDALGYGIVAVVPTDPPKAPGAPRLIGYQRDGRTPVYVAPDQEEIGWSETRYR